MSPRARALGPRLYDRRTLLAAACAGCGVAACGPGTPTDAGARDAPVGDAAAGACTSEDAGVVADFPVGMTVRVDALAVVIGHDASGLWAIDATCPHFGGRIEPQSDGTLRCSNTEGGAASHGARYDADGTNTLAEAMRPANARYDRPNYAVAVCEGRVLVDRATVVPRGTRSPAV